MATLKFTSNISEARREFRQWTEDEIRRSKMDMRAIEEAFTEHVARSTHVAKGILRASVRGFSNDSGDEFSARVEVGGPEAYYAAWEASREGHDMFAGMGAAEDAIDAVMDGRPTPSLNFDKGEATH